MERISAVCDIGNHSFCTVPCDCACHDEEE